MAQTPNATNNTVKFSPDSPDANQLQLGLGFSSSYDDNAFNTVQGDSQVLFSPTPSVQWNVARSRWNSQFKYDAFISRSSKYDLYSRTSHTLDTTFTYVVSRSLSFIVQDDFIRSADPFFSVGSTGTGLVGPQNPSFFGPPTLRTSNLSDLEADYRLDAHTTIAIGGNYYFQHYTDVPQASLRDSNDAAGRASFQHEISPRMSIGTSYDYTKITTPAGFSTVSQRIMLTDDYTFNPNMKLTLFAGPNHVSNEFVLLHNGGAGVLNSADWTWSAGGTYTWNTERMTMKGSAIRQVSDGGGLIGTVQMTSFQYQLERRLPYKLTGSIYAGYSINDELTPQNGKSITHNYGTAGASITRALTRQLNIKLAYDRSEQTSPGVFVGNPWIDRNRVTASINYVFTHPLGR